MMDLEGWIILGVITLANIGCAFVSRSYARLAQKACRHSLGIKTSDRETRKETPNV